jgi:hypothetical protein
LDGLFRDGDRVVARLLPGDTLVIDPAAVSSDFADRDGPNLCPSPETDKYGRGGAGGEKDKDYEDQIKLLVNPDNPTPRGYGYKFYNPQTGQWVYMDDCQHKTGLRVEIKGEYDDLLAFPGGKDSLTEDWLKQSRNQIQANENFPVMWVFAQHELANFARNIFNGAKDGQKRIQIRVVPRMGGSQ